MDTLLKTLVVQLRTYSRPMHIRFGGESKAVLHTMLQFPPKKVPVGLWCTCGLQINMILRSIRILRNISRYRQNKCYRATDSYYRTIEDEIPVYSSPHYHSYFCTVFRTTTNILPVTIYQRSPNESSQKTITAGAEREPSETTATDQGGKREDRDAMNSLLTVPLFCRQQSPTTTAAVWSYFYFMIVSCFSMRPLL